MCFVYLSNHIMVCGLSHYIRLSSLTDHKLKSLPRQAYSPDPPSLAILPHTSVFASKKNPRQLTPPGNSNTADMSRSR